MENVGHTIINIMRITLIQQNLLYYPSKLMKKLINAFGVFYIPLLST